MTVLQPSKIETVATGGQGYNDIYTANFQKLNQELFQKQPWQFPAKDRDLNSPPGSPSDGDRYIVGSSPSGDWAGQANNIAIWDDNNTAWIFATATEGMTAWLEDENTYVTFDGSNWDLTLKRLATSLQTYSESNVTTSRSFDADTVTLPELADIVGTIVADLRTLGLIS